MTQPGQGEGKMEGRGTSYRSAQRPNRENNQKKALQTLNAWRKERKREGRREGKGKDGVESNDWDRNPFSEPAELLFGCVAHKGH